MRKIIENLKFKTNHEIILIIVLTAISLSILAAPRFLGLGQKTSNYEQEKYSKEELALESSRLRTEPISQEENKDSNKSPSQFENNNQPNGSSAVKGATTKTVSPKTSETAENPKTQTVVLKVDTGTNSYSYNVFWKEDMSVYDILVKASNENKFSLVSTWYGAPLNSYYITEIHGFSCQCWTYKLEDKNGVEVPGSGEGASLDTVVPENITTWKAN